MTLPLDIYDRMVRDGTLTEDPAQRAAAKLLQQLARELRGYRPGRRRGLFGSPVKAPRGVYLWGGVGAGKSLLMDLFIENAPIAAKRRVHFHAFMRDVHAFIAMWRGLDEGARRAHPARVRKASLDDPIPHAANAVFEAAHLLCFDEFHVTDITDAMLLGRLFENLFDMGAVIVATSNRHPNDLYKDGINRQLFLPFIEALKDNLTIRELVAEKDYRLDRLENAAVYFHPLGQLAEDAMTSAWHDLTAGAMAEPETMQVNGRDIVVPFAARGNARGTFDHWCRQPLGPADYLELAASYPTVFIDHIPKMDKSDRNAAKRFVTLIDALYEARCKLICSAAAPPDQLYPAGDGAFEFGRTVSRLNEMQSTDYIRLAHIADTPAS